MLLAIRFKGSKDFGKRISSLAEIKTLIYIHAANHP